ncbi:MAG: hypothetical protein KC912_18990 [Proteobacteria bacterium]|nr:hypothetical protein [Pseudomonadota bacterium]
MKYSLVAVSLALFVGCAPREAGPHSGEFGQVLFWSVTSLDLTSDACTDDPEFAEATEPPVLEENSFLMYRVSDDGATAVSMSCTETRASSCTEGDLVFDVQGHELTLDRDGGNVTSVGDCNVSALQQWSIVDAGESGTMAVDMSFPMTGDANDCGAAEDIIANGGTNGFGLADCSIQLTAELEFFTAD